jgi:glycosyltransferase involved in cell wall biosynthesis
MSTVCPVRVAHVTTIDATLRVLLLHQLQAMRDAGFEVAGVSSSGPWTKDLEREGIRHFAVQSLNRQRDPLSDLRALVDLVRLFRRERFTIVHTHMPKTGVLGRLAAHLAGVPIIVNTVHGPYGIERDRGLRRWFFLTLERLAAGVSDFELCQSREIFDLFTNLGIFRAERSAHLGNGIDLRYLDPGTVDHDAVAALRRELNIPPGAPVIGTVGRLTVDKGYREFIAAHQTVTASRPDAVFIACGPADDRDALPPRLIEGAEAKGVRFLGFRSDMREIYALMDLFVMASYHEGFPRAAMEAAAMGKPLVLTDIRGCREVVTHGREGFLIPVRQVGPLAQAILHLLEDDGLRRRYGEASRKRALAEFDERHVVDHVLTTYRRLLTIQEGVEIRGRLGAEGTARR